MNSPTTTALRAGIEDICEKYGYFLGLAYEGEDGSLKTHPRGKVVSELEALLQTAIREAKAEAYADCGSKGGSGTLVRSYACAKSYAYKKLEASDV